MPLILGTNSIKDTGYNVANSLRLDDGSSAYMHKTPGSAGNRRTFTLSIWFKISAVDTGTRFLFSAQSDGNNYSILRMENHQLQWLVANSGSVVGNLLTNQLLRDPSAWMNVIIAVDTTDGTSGNRQKMYINGTQVTSFATETQPNQNTDFTMNNTVEHDIGSFGAGSYFDGYLAEVVSIDGSQLTPTSFGEFDEDSPTIWKPIDVSGLTFGTNGFYLQFKQSGTSANSSGIGADTSGNDHHFTVNNLTAVDQSTDTCTNNFCTLSNITPSSNNNREGNLLHYNNAGSHDMRIGTIAVTTGKWYAEVKAVELGSTYPQMGIINPDKFDDYNYLGKADAGYGYLSNGNKQYNNSATSFGDTYATNDIISIAMDLDNNKLYFGKNGTWQNSGDPTSGSSGTGSAYDLVDGVYYTFGGSTYDGGTDPQFSWNFGSPAFSISSGNADANGYGNFEYAVPSGYYSINTKNLAEFG